MFSYSKYKTTSYAMEFILLDFGDEWYQINVPSTGPGWINGKDVLKITQKEKEAIEPSPSGKAALYQRFADLYPDSSFAQNAKDKADDLYYGLANEEGTINSYSNYLKKYPDGKHAKVARLKLDTLTFQDEDLFNNTNRLKRWITDNPESTFIEKAKNRIDELTFVQAKYDKNVKSLELYIAEYPQGKFVIDAKQIIEGIKYNQAITTSPAPVTPVQPRVQESSPVTSAISSPEATAVLQQVDISKEATFTINTKGGEKYIGEILPDEITFKSAHGIVHVKPENMASFSGGKMQTKDGTSIKGIINQETIKIKTGLLGELEIKTSDIESITR